MSPVLICGLPRSGSTLLACLLNQNPDFFASGPSPVAQYINNFIDTLSAHAEAKHLTSNQQIHSIISALFQGYHNNTISDNTHLIFDTNRNWPRFADLLVEVFPNIRFIICVRNIQDIALSLERIRQGSQLKATRFFRSGTTLEERIDQSISAKGIIGGAISATRDLMEGPHSDRAIVMDYDFLVTTPICAFTNLYKSLRLNDFDHDFENFKTSFEYFDNFLDAPNLHTVEGPLVRRAPDGSLPPRIYKKLDPLNKLIFKCSSESIWLDKV